MIFMKKSFIAVLLVLLTALAMLGGCSNADPKTPDNSVTGDNQQNQVSSSQPSAPASGSSDTDNGPQGYPFEAGGVQIYVCMEAETALNALPEPKSVFEAPSCAFEGVDITYFYPGFELTTYPDSGKERVLSIALTDDSVTTPEGVYIGASFDSVTKAYGDGYTQNGGQYTYTKGKGSLVFTLENDAITGILYRFDT